MAQRVPVVVFALTGQFLAARQYEDARRYFAERAEAVPDQPLFLALTGFFQVLTGRDVGEALGMLDRAVSLAPGLANYFRGLALAELPVSAGTAEAAVADLQLVLTLGEQFPTGYRRAAHAALAKAYAALGRGDEARPRWSGRGRCRAILTSRCS